MSEAKRRPFVASTSFLKILPLIILLAACAPNFSPNTYSSDAVQRASKVDSGVVVGVRKVAISVDSNVATATGAAAGGISGSQVADKTVSALSALGGAVLGGIAGNKVGHNIQDTYGYEYIVRKPNGDLLSVTQKDKKPLKIGEHVLLIQGPQARIVKDYTESLDANLAASANKPQSPNEPKPDLSPKIAPPPAPVEASTATSTDTATPDPTTTPLVITPATLSPSLTSPTTKTPEPTPAVEPPAAKAPDTASPATPSDKPDAPVEPASKETTNPEPITPNMSPDNTPSDAAPKP